MITIRLLLSLDFIYNWKLKQLDINNAFLHGEFKEYVYLVAPPELTSIKLEQVCKLKRLYMALSKPTNSGFPNCHPFRFLRDILNL